MADMRLPPKAIEAAARATVDDLFKQGGPILPWDKLDQKGKERICRAIRIGVTKFLREWL